MHVYVEESWNQNQYMVVIVDGKLQFKAYVDKYETTIPDAILRALTLYDSRRFPSHIEGLGGRCWHAGKGRSTADAER